MSDFQCHHHHRHHHHDHHDQYHHHHHHEAERVARGWIRQDLAADSESTLTTRPRLMQTYIYSNDHQDAENDGNDDREDRER